VVLKVPFEHAGSHLDARARLTQHVQAGVPQDVVDGLLDQQALSLDDGDLALDSVRVGLVVRRGTGGRLRLSKGRLVGGCWWLEQGRGRKRTSLVAVMLGGKPAMLRLLSSVSLLAWGLDVLVGLGQPNFVGFGWKKRRIRRNSQQNSARVLVRSGLCRVPKGQRALTDCIVVGALPRRVPTRIDR
jgi:hypothetical protein